MLCIFSFLYIFTFFGIQIGGSLRPKLTDYSLYFSGEGDKALSFYLREPDWATGSNPFVMQGLVKKKGVEMVDGLQMLILVLLQ